MKAQQKNSRREFIRKSVFAAAGTISILSFNGQRGFSISSSEAVSTVTGDDDAFKLPPLPYAYNALEPYIDAKTMEIHYTKHHQAYIDKLNAAVAKAPELKGKTIEQLLSMISSLPDSVKMQIRNQGGGHWNHSFFWQNLAPKSDDRPTGKLRDAITSQWQSFENFQEQFKQAGMGVFGSGWVWLVADANGKVSIVTTPNQDNTLMDISKDRGKAIMGVDVWEHAYYLKHQNKRTDYLDDIWNVINWKKAVEVYG